MSMRLAILKTTTGKEGEEIILEMNEEAVVSHLTNLVLSNLPIKYQKSWYGKEKLQEQWTQDEIISILKQSWQEVVGIFKRETVKIL